MSFESLPARCLDKYELRTLVDDLANDTESWHEHVDFPDGQRHYVSLHRDEYVDVWLLCWTPENDTGWHDHDISSGAVAVVGGELVENNLTLMHGSRETKVAAGKVFSFGGD